MVDIRREYKEPNLVDAIETGAGILTGLTDAVLGTLRMAQTVSGAVPNFVNGKEGMFNSSPEVQSPQYFGGGPERGG